jgi:hypothetical protein
MKKYDIIFLSILLVIGLLALLGFKLYENHRSTGNAYAKIFYQDVLILMIDLETNDYIIYNTTYKNDIYVDRAEEGIFYVPGALMTAAEMAELWAQDDYAFQNEIVGIRLVVKDAKIEVDYQWSPRDLCELQPPTNSNLQPIVCLPNRLVVSVITSMQSDEFIPDTVME